MNASNQVVPIPRTVTAGVTIAPVGAGNADAEERSWLGRVANGDAAAFEALVKRHTVEVGRLVSRVLGWPDAAEVEDALQEVFAKVWMRAGAFRGDAAPGTWIVVIALNVCRSWQRSTWIRRVAMARLRGAGRPVSPSADVETEQADTCRRVRVAVRALRRVDREVIALHYLQGYPSAEVARVLGISVGAVDVRLHRARQRLRELLGGDRGRDLL